MATEEEEDTSALLHTRERERNGKKMTTTMADLHQEPSDSSSGLGSDPNSDSDAAATAEDEEEAQAPHRQSIFLDPTKEQSVGQLGAPSAVGLQAPRAGRIHEAVAKFARKMSGTIIPTVINALNYKAKSIKDHEVLTCGAGNAEVTVNRFRYAVNLSQKTCSCRAWQVTGKPCTHALAFISKISREVRMDDFVHEYFSIEQFKKAYACSFNPMTSKDNWPHVDLGYKIKKPKLRRKPGRPRNYRIKAFDEATTSKKRKLCSKCGELGHIAKYCQGGPTASQKRNCSSSQNDSSSQASIGRGRGRGRGRGSASGSAGPETEGAERAGTEGRGRGGRLAALLGIV